MIISCLKINYMYMETELFYINLKCKKCYWEINLVYTYMNNTVNVEPSSICFIEISICCTFYIVLFLLTGNPPDPGLCGCTEQ